MKKTLLLIVTGIGLAALSASASTITAINGTPYQTPALTGFSTFGDQVAGMGVWVSFSDNSVQQANWAVTGGGAGAASVASFFSISESGDTFNVDAWTLRNLSTSLSITGFRLFGASGDTIFDRASPAPGTLGSANGRDFAMGGNYITHATYSDILNLTTFAAVGDEYVTLSVVFDDSTPFRAGASQSFTQDTDSADARGSITTVPDVGSTAMLFGFGLMGLAALKRRLL